MGILQKPKCIQGQNSELEAGRWYQKCPSTCCHHCVGEGECSGCILILFLGQLLAPHPSPRPLLIPLSGSDLLPHSTSQTTPS